MTRWERGGALRISLTKPNFKVTSLGITYCYWQYNIIPTCPKNNMIHVDNKLNNFIVVFGTGY